MIKTYIDGVLQVTPIVLRHNQIIGLNDDVNFQHITATDRTNLNNLSGTNTGDETASTIINKIGDGSKINSNYLPSYVDDVLEFANVASFPATGENGKIYIALDVNLTYRWGGSGYVEISPSIALGETSATAYRGDRGASAYAHSILTNGTNPHNTTFANIASKPTTIAGYGITDGVTLTGNETLTNKTLTSPVLNTSVTGTAITTTGEANKLVKVNSSGRVVLGGADDGINKLQINGSAKLSSLAGTGNRMVVADSTGKLSTSDCCLTLATGNNIPIKVVKNISLVNNNFSDLFNFYSSGGFASANYIGGVTGELKIKVIGLNSSYAMVDSYRTFLISTKQQADGNITITKITPKDTLDNGVVPTITVQAKTGNTNVSAKVEISVTFTNFLECNIIAEIECLSTSNLSNSLIKIN